MSGTVLVVARDPRLGQQYVTDGDAAFGKVALPKVRRIFERTEEVFIECHVEAYEAWEKLRRDLDLDQLIFEYPILESGGNYSVPPERSKADQVVIISPDGKKLKAHAFKLRK